MQNHYCDILTACNIWTLLSFVEVSLKRIISSVLVRFGCFLNFWISQSSVATQWMWDGNLYHRHIESFLWICCLLKNIENRLTLAEANDQYVLCVFYRVIVSVLEKRPDTNAIMWHCITTWLHCNSKPIIIINTHSMLSSPMYTYILIRLINK